MRFFRTSSEDKYFKNGPRRCAAAGAFLQRPRVAPEPPSAPPFHTSPQLKKYWQTGQACDLSPTMFLVLSLGVGLWSMAGPNATVQSDLRHFEPCHACGQLVDLSDLEAVASHAEALPHPPAIYPRLWRGDEHDGRWCRSRVAAEIVERARGEDGPADLVEMADF